MDVRGLKDKIDKGAGRLLGGVTYGEGEGVLLMYRVPLMAMHAVENLASPYGVRVLRDEEVCFDLAIG